MNFVKKIVDGKSDELVHLQFQKFSKGEFLNRALIKAKHTGNKYTIVTGPEFANELVRDGAEKLGSNTTNVTGGIISTSDLTGEIDFKSKKQFQGVKTYLIDKEMTGNDLISLLNKFPKTFFALSFDVGEDFKLKVKPKAPTSGKPGKGGEKPKVDFCRLVTTDEKIGKSFIFEVNDFKDAEVNHSYHIDNIIMPVGEKDFVKIREMAKRKGKIVRIAEIDGKEMKKDIAFEA